MSNLRADNISVFLYKSVRLEIDVSHRARRDTEFLA